MKAARWMTVIIKWFRMREADTQIELEHRWKPGTVGSLAQKIRRVIAGERQDGLPRTGKCRGRPKKIPTNPSATFGEDRRAAHLRGRVTRDN